MEGKVKEKKRAGKERGAEYLDTAEGLADEDALSLQQFQSLERKEGYTGAYTGETLGAPTPGA